MKMGWTSRGRLWRREERCYMIGRKLQMENTLWQGEELSQKQLNGTSLLGDNLKCNTNATFLGDQGGFKYGMPQRQFWTTNFPVREEESIVMHASTCLDIQHETHCKQVMDAVWSHSGHIFKFHVIISNYNT